MAQLSLEDGNCIEKPLLFQTVAYDIQGNKIEDSSFSIDGSLIGKTLLTYDPTGRLTEEAHYRSEEILIGTSEYKYDTNGRPIEKVSFTNDGHLASKKICNYDSSGRKEEELFIEDAAFEANTVSYQVEDALYNIERARLVRSMYDADDRLTEVLFYSSDGSLITKLNMIYDIDGNLIREAQSTGVGLLAAKVPELADLLPVGSPLFIREFAYDSHGRKIEEKRYVGESLESKKVFTYDVEGVKTEEAEYETGDTLRSRVSFEYEFNSLGDWTKETVSRQVGESGRFEPVAVKYRTITYY